MKINFYVIARSVFERRSNLKRLLHSLRSFAMTLVFLSFSGCSILSHLDELSMMGDFSRDKDNQKKIIQRVKDNYDALVAAINTQQMSSYTNQVDIRNKFGEPIAIKDIKVDGKKQQRWMYRYALIRESKDKVYVYFDERQSLIKYEQEKIEWF